MYIYIYDTHIKIINNIIGTDIVYYIHTHIYIYIYTHTFANVQIHMLKLAASSVYQKPPGPLYPITIHQNSH